VGRIIDERASMDSVFLGEREEVIGGERVGGILFKGEEEGAGGCS